MTALNPVTLFFPSPDGTVVGHADGAYVPTLGYRVTKVEDVETATGVDLFTVTGNILLTTWVGEVTNALHTTVTDYKLRIKTIDIDLCAATNLSSAVVGYKFALSGDATKTILTGSDYAVSVAKANSMKGLGLAYRFIGSIGGTCTLQSNRTAGAASDSITHTIWYWPLEADAIVVAT